MYVDVREADELEEGMIYGAMNIPFGQLRYVVISIKNESIQDPRLWEIAINQNTNKVYVTGHLSNSV
jgi:rhodanese-related sulfurtransferase